MHFSVIIPTIGRNTLKKVIPRLCDAAIFNPQKTEILIVEDQIASKQKKDLRTKILRKLRQEHKISVHFLVRDDEVRSVASARNMALDKARGEVIVFLADDTIPAADWWNYLHDFYQQKNKKEVMLGSINYPRSWKDQEFYQFLEQVAKFDFGALRAGKKPDYRHFYTSNLAIWSSSLDKERFVKGFTGWGFEDIELGYRLWKKGLAIRFVPQWSVVHEDKITLKEFLHSVRQSQTNAQIMAKIHPELQISPKGLKLLLLKIAMLLATTLGLFFRRYYLWAQWKKAWIKR